MSNNKHMIIGYYPLLYPHNIGISPGHFIDSKDMIDRLSKIDEVDVSSGGVIWTANGDRVSPIMVFRSHAAELAKHIKYWCDNDFSRLSLQFQMRGDSYAMVVMPDVSKTIERVKLAGIIYESDVLIRDNVSIIYKPLMCYCPTSESYKKIVEHFPDVSSMDLRFIELPDLGNTDMSKIDFINDSIDVGTFEVKKPDAISQQHFDNIFEN